MRKNFGSKPWFYPLPVLIIGTYDENGNADDRILGEKVGNAFSDGNALK